MRGREPHDTQTLDRSHGKGDLEQPQSTREAGGRNRKTRGSPSQPRKVDPPGSVLSLLEAVWLRLSAGARARESRLL